MSLKSTKSQIEDFKNSFIWKDLKKEINEWKKSLILENMCIVDEMDNNTSTPSILIHLGHISGRIKSADFFLSLPEILLSGVVEKEKEEKKEN